MIAPSIFCGDLSFFCTDSDLDHLFQAIGPVKSAIVRRSRQHETLHYGFVHMETLEDSLLAIQKLNGFKFLGRKLRMNLGSNCPQEDEQEPSFQMHVSFISHNTNFTINEEQLDRIFNQFGPIKDCIVKQFSISSDPAKQCGYGFVFFENEDSVYRAISASNFALIENIHFDCKMSHHTATKGPRPFPSTHSSSHVTAYYNSSSSSGESNSNAPENSSGTCQTASSHPQLAGGITPVVASPNSLPPCYIPPVANTSNHASPQILSFSQFPPSPSQLNPNQLPYYSFPASMPPILRTPLLVPAPGSNQGHSATSATSVGTNSLPWSGGSGSQLLPAHISIHSTFGAPNTATWPMIVGYPAVAFMSPVLPESAPSGPMVHLSTSQTQYPTTAFPVPSHNVGSINYAGNYQFLSMQSQSFPLQSQTDSYAHQQHQHLYPSSPQLPYGHALNNGTDSPAIMPASFSPSSHLSASQITQYVPYQQQAHAHSHSLPQSIAMYSTAPDSTDSTVLPLRHVSQEASLYHHQHGNSDSLRTHPPRHS